jgi:hypothetical protein
VILVDANVFMYAAGKPSPQRPACRRFLREIVEGSHAEQACTDAEVLQEILHRYRAIAPIESAFAIFDAVLALGIRVLPVTREALLHARVLLEEHPELSTRDALHAGVMKAQALERVMTYDADFDSIPWIERITPSMSTRR